MITLRPAKITDAAELAILDNLASHGLAYWIWQNAIANRHANLKNVQTSGTSVTDPFEWGRHQMADDSNEFGYSSAVIAEIDNQVSGSATGYVLAEEHVGSQKYDSPVLVPIDELLSGCIGSWYLESLAVYSHCQKQGVAAALMKDCVARAQANNADNMVLLVEDSNKAALALYHSMGFVEKERRKYVPFNTTATTQNWLLLVANVSRI